MRLFLAFIATLTSFHAFSAPKSELWPYWNTSNESDTTKVDHQPWQQILDKYLVTEGEYTLFKYSSVSGQDKQQLNHYLAQLSHINPLQLSKAEQYPYWVNLYNAITVDLILDAYPIKSITKLGGLFSFGPWGDEVVTINGKELTLNDIEHRILRPIWNDPRTHYAVNCASLGCPNLQSQAFTADNTEALLQQAATTFINSEKGVLIKNGKTQLSSIYDWFADDFGNNHQLIQHLAKYRPELSDISGKFSYEYDWDLNEKKQ
ncbi:DUF547 domain-containing protein [Vibrio coralliilyticus]|uniref:DUF547 domain-containing protein n=1 Tax=Vibrio coralliilyticus TaxID=190893 RepID=A0AAP6ZQN1_9VIBR|nr:DUF547 domain-containing protein [Vibrio coralliilyticus]NOJ24771.1 DUF547 domain-containing protein [Vibrio coralliilyticus]